MRKALVGLLVCLLVLGGGFVALDQWARGRAEQRVATSLSSRLGGTPTVTTHGWPFLATLVTHHLAGVDLAMAQASAKVEGRSADVTNLVVHGQDVSNATDIDQARFTILDGSAHMSWSELSSALGATVSSGGGSRVTVKKQVAFQGSTIDAVVTGTPSVSDGRLALSDATASVDQMQFTGAIGQQVADLATSKLTLPTLAGVSISSLAPDATGVTVGIHGTDVLVSKLR